MRGTQAIPLKKLNIMYFFSVIFVFSEISESFPCTENDKKQENTNATTHEYNKGKKIKNIHFIFSP